MIALFLSFLVLVVSYCLAFVLSLLLSTAFALQAHLFKPVDPEGCTWQVGGCFLVCKLKLHHNRKSWKLLYAACFRSRDELFGIMYDFSRILAVNEV